MPASAPVPIAEKIGLFTATGCPPEMMYESPSVTSSIAKVVMNGGKFNLTTGSALTQPAAAPTASPASSVTITSSTPASGT